ncbi:hypothetical protein BEWA_018370 [Theileria equi strain WA]|uniref:Uncharacterized protein n=1 Tax=Theileria equi strain WA TaxID=1537102 RepID=L0AUT5_THEEQ|nr:hypothetical protein BEWA_018370 [Theileria equi strain WA]AFZ78993.1 hypothetical protein BEWA_018370 [Theileria equi strain WA]|eukprot:XP_004828659.1 hypothetical protein BEWA_018370 [Theileria equi strain WA]
MFLSRLKSSLPFSQINNFRHLLRTSDAAIIDIKQFHKQICELYTYFTPYESLDAAKVLCSMNESQLCEIPLAELNEVKRLLVDGIRSKLYVMANVDELCAMTLSVTNYGMLNRQYLSDFICRLDRLMMSVAAENVPMVSDSLIRIHLTGYKIENVARKFFLHLITKKIVPKLDGSGLIKLLDSTIIKERLRNNEILLDDAINILNLNCSTIPSLIYINRLLLRTVIAEVVE